MRKRLRDWPIMVYKYRAYIQPEELPDVFWDHEEWKNAVWNQMVDRFSQALIEWETVKSADDKAHNRAFWDDQWADVMLIARTSPLPWAGRVVREKRVRTAEQRGFYKGSGFPRKRLNSDRMRIVHKFTGGGKPIEGVVGSRAWRFAIHEQPPGGAYADNSHEARRKRIVAARFGLDGEWFDFRLRLHRPLPEGAILKQATWLGRHRPGPQGQDRWVWHVALTLEIPPNEGKRPLRRVAGLDLGWRKFDDYLRVGYLYDGCNKIELRLPLDTSNYRTRRDGLPATWDDKWHYDAVLSHEMNSAKADVKRMLDGVELPRDIRASVAQIQKMGERGLKRLAARLGALRDTEFWSMGVAEAQLRLEAWVAENRNHRYWLNRLSERLVNRRKWTYGNLAAWLAQNYDVVAWEGDLDIKGMAEGDASNEAVKASQKYRQIAAIGDLRQLVRQATAKLGAALLDCESAGTTNECTVCGALVETGPALLLECENGHIMDQDLNASRNLYSQIPPDLRPAEGLRSSTGVDNNKTASGATESASEAIFVQRPAIPKELEGVATFVHSG